MSLFFERERKKERERKRKTEREMLDCDGDGDLDGSLVFDCNTLQHTAKHCNTLQNTATHGSLSLSLFPSFFLSPTCALFLAFSLSLQLTLSLTLLLSRARALSRSRSRAFSFSFSLSLSLSLSLPPSLSLFLSERKLPGGYLKWASGSILTKQKPCKFCNTLYCTVTHCYALKISSRDNVFSAYGVATISRLLQMIGLFCKRAL